MVDQRTSSHSGGLVMIATILLYYFRNAGPFLPTSDTNKWIQLLVGQEEQTRCSSYKCRARPTQSRNPPTIKRALQYPDSQPMRYSIQRHLQ